MNQSKGVAGGGWGGWNKKVAMWDWHEECLTGYPGWEMDGNAPPSVFFARVQGQPPSSRDIAAKFDDIAQGKFYYRDFTEDTLPVVRDGDVYHSRFWFSSMNDKQLFLERFGEITGV